MIDVTLATKRRTELQTQLEQATAAVNQIRGALAILDELLAPPKPVSAADDAALASALASAAPPNGDDTAEPAPDRDSDLSNL
jgi:hypothetical protein